MGRNAKATGCSRMSLNLAYGDVLLRAAPMLLIAVSPNCVLIGPGSMALTEMQRLGREAHKRCEIAHVGIVHRTGRLEIGETSVVIAVSAPHRRAAFEACEWIIKELKRTVPIWKKEVYEDGEEWVGIQD